MMYASSGIRSYVPPGGVCKGHFRPVDMKSKHPITGKIVLSIRCDVCEPLLENDPFWSISVDGVPLTPDEEKKIEAEKSKANQAMGVFGAEMFETFQQIMKDKGTKDKAK